MESKSDEETSGSKSEVSLKKLEKKFGGKDGTVKLKEFCKDKGVKYTNKQEAIMALFALQEGKNA